MGRVSERALKVLRHIDAVEADPLYYAAQEIEDQATELDWYRRKVDDRFAMWKELLDFQRRMSFPQRDRFMEAGSMFTGVFAVMMFVVVILVLARSR